MNEDQFWQSIEDAWSKAGGHKELRAKLASIPSEEEPDQALYEPLARVIGFLKSYLHELPQADLLEYDRILERKLYDIDRSEIQAFTDGSDDGFLYARGFIVAVGRSYYEAVDRDPSKAIMDAECEDMCYLPHHIYHERFGDVPKSGISRESASNPEGWRE